MTIHQTSGPRPTSPVLCLDDLDTSAREPRVYDFTLARALGYRHARNIRRLIKASRAELETHGELVCREDRTGGTGDLLPAGANARAGRPGTAFYLNEAQALVLCAITRTAVAARARGEIIRVFMAWRAGRVPAGGLAGAEREALQRILAHADVVMAPRYVGTSLLDPADDGEVPYILAPITDAILDTLAEFEAHDDREPDVDDEPDVDLEETCEDEGAQCEDEGAEFDGEPSLGSTTAGEDESQAKWAQGYQDGADRELAVEAGLGRRRSKPRQDYDLSRGGYYRGESAIAAAEASRRLRSIIVRMAGIEAHGDLLPVRAN